MTRQINLVAISGSLRAASHNTALLRATQELAPEGVTITILPINDIPMFNQDDEGDVPASVIALREAVAASDGLLLACPEYNGSYTGALKNAIDWISRDGSILARKPVATLGGSPGALGATKAQEHLRAVCTHLNMYLMSRPTLAVPFFFKKIEDGKLVDEQTRGFMSEFLVAFTAWVNLTNPA